MARGSSPMSTAPESLFRDRGTVRARVSGVLSSGVMGSLVAGLLWVPPAYAAPSSPGSPSPSPVAVGSVKARAATRSQTDGAVDATTGQRSLPAGGSAVVLGTGAVISVGG